MQPVWRRAGGRASPAAWHPTSPVCSSAEPGGRAAQGEAGPGLRGEVGRQPDNGGSSPAPDAMPQVRGLPADRVRRVPLLQGHEEVRRPRADEAELHHAPVHRGECAAPRPSSRRAGPASGPPPSAAGGLSLCLKRMFQRRTARETLPWEERGRSGGLTRTPRGGPRGAACAQAPSPSPSDGLVAPAFPG